MKLTWSVMGIWRPVCDQYIWDALVNSDTTALEVVCIT